LERLLNECLIALGGNVHISEVVFADTVSQLKLRGCTDIRMSRILKTRPVGVAAGNEFLNAAAILRTNLSALEMLHTMHEVEAIFQRVRTRHWGPRTLDLDLLLHGNQISNLPGLVLPHPAMWYRRFVLEPASEVAADMVHPILNESVQSLFDRLNCRPLQLEICGTGMPHLSELPELEGYSAESILMKVVDPAAAIDPGSFARINVRQGKPSTTLQPYNPNCREIAVIGESNTDVLSRIEHLRIAMLG
jgi:2-amino-4-hydroxy-6-hydroxymethyldihydropteridine diphosphokinase